MARTGWVVTPEDLETIKDMASRGAAEYVIAKAMNVHPNTFQKRKAADKEIAQAIEDGKGQLKEWAASKMISIMMDDNHPKMFNALQFFLKTQGGWSETRTIVEAGISAPSSIRFEMDED